MDTPAATQTAEEILSEPGAPVVMFDQVELAFDEKVVLRNISCSDLASISRRILVFSAISSRETVR